MSRLTDVPGSSDYVAGGAVLYSNELKTALGQVPAELIRRTARSASRSRWRWPKGYGERTGANVGVGITGIAGPGGGTPAEAGWHRRCCRARRRRAGAGSHVLAAGGRTQIKFNATQAALDMVRRALGR